MARTYGDAEEQVTAQRRLAAIDVGSNTVRALVVEMLPDGRMVRLADRFEMTALGRGLVPGGDMDDEAIRQTAEFVAGFLQQVGEVDDVYCVGTAAMRDAANTPDLQRALRETAGVELVVLSGVEEARLTFIGAVAEVGRTSGQAPLVADVGGRSTELAVLRDGRLDALSVALGARSVTETHLRSDPPTDEELAAARDEAERALDAHAELLRAADVFVAAGGTACSAALLAGEQSELSHTYLRQIQGRICRMPLEHRREALAFDPLRAEVICGGLVVLERLAARVPNRRVIMTAGGIREGLLLTNTGAARLA
jgi:exopolyphosphatase / guanosine-5'-triphosphate,3'-diphosphate pyrophosphatase